MKTVLTIKTDKTIKDQARKVADEFGIPLGTIINAFLRQFVRNKELSLDISYKPTPYLMKIIEDSREEYKRGEFNGPFTGEELIKHLKKL